MYRLSRYRKSLVLMATALASVLFGGTPQAQTTKGDRIPQRLFAKGNIDRSKSCSVSL